MLYQFDSTETMWRLLMKLSILACSPDTSWKEMYGDRTIWMDWSGILVYVDDLSPLHVFKL